MDKWKVLQQWYQVHLGVPPKTLDYVATFPILSMCARGKCIEAICRELDFDEEYVIDTLDSFFQFIGFEKDLGFDSRYLFIRYRYNKYAYLTVARTLDPETSNSDLEKSYAINIIFDEIERKVQEYESTA